jgi:MFS family permease
MLNFLKQRDVLIPTLLAAGILMITMGSRQTIGLYVGPMNSSTGLGIATISFALAVSQFIWGAIQPIAGAAADKYGSRPVLLTGLGVVV